MSDQSLYLQQQVDQARLSDTPLRICGNGSKSFLCPPPDASHRIELGSHRGIVSYDPSELVLTARSGTTLREIEAELAKHGQMLAFEPPHFGEGATLGGTIACALSGPRRPHSGAARDFVLGCKLLNGRGEILQFGGQVMKNVAGYDVSRLMVGAYGTLGVLLEISLKVLPRPAASLTVTLACDEHEAIARMTELLIKPYPIDAACYDGEQCHVRVSGSVQAVKEARGKIAGIVLPDEDGYWHKLREHRLPYFQHRSTLYRIMVRPATAPLPIKGSWLLDWGGSQRWLYSDEDYDTIRHQVELAGGHVTVFRTQDDQLARFHPLPDAMLALHQRLRASFDPHLLFNRHHLYG